MIQVPVALKFVGKHTTLPQYATPGSAAVDLIADIDAPTKLFIGERFKVPTGIAVQPLESGWASFILPRSGLGSKGIIISNVVGLIDMDYTDQLYVTLWNTGDESFTVEPGMRMAQLVFLPVGRAEFTVVPELQATQRNGGFGSTGL